MGVCYFRVWNQGVLPIVRWFRWYLFFRLLFFVEICRMRVIAESGGYTYRARDLQLCVAMRICSYSRWVWLWSCFWRVGIWRCLWWGHRRGHSRRWRVDGGCLRGERVLRGRFFPWGCWLVGGVLVGLWFRVYAILWVWWVGFDRQFVQVTYYIFLIGLNAVYYCLIGVIEMIIWIKNYITIWRTNSWLSISIPNALILALILLSTSCWLRQRRSVWRSVWRMCVDFILSTIMVESSINRRFGRRSWNDILVILFSIMWRNSWHFSTIKIVWISYRW